MPIVPANPSRSERIGSATAGWRAAPARPLLLHAFAWFALAGALLPSSAAGQTRLDDLATTQHLVLWAYAVDYLNTPVAGVTLRHEGAGTTPGTVETGRDGAARIEGTRLGQSVRVEVEDADWHCPVGESEGEIGGNPLLFQVFRSDARQMSRDERLAAHRARIRTLMRERREAAARGEPLPVDAPPPGDDPLAAAPDPGADRNALLHGDPIWGYQANRHIISFLAGLRYEDPRGLSLSSTDEASTLTAQVELAILDGLGHPVPNVAVDLLQMKPETGTRILLVAIERTDAQGQATFRGLHPGRWYRAECQTDEGLVGRTSVFRVQPTETRELSPLVIRPANRTLGGFVLRSEGPARHARVHLLGTDGKPVLSTVADIEGYFTLGPVGDRDPVVLEISHFDPTRVDLTLPIQSEREAPELLIPLDALARGRTPPPIEGVTPPE